MKLLCRGYCTDDNLNWGDWVYVEISEKDLRDIHKMREAVQKLKRQLGDHIQEISAYDGSARYFERLGPISDEMREHFEDGNSHIMLPEDWEPNDAESEEARTDYDRVLVSDSGVWWRAMFKHASVEAWTVEIPFSALFCENHGPDPRKKRTCLVCIAKGA